MKNLLRLLTLSLVIVVTSFSCTPEYQELNNNDVANLLTRYQWNVQLTSGGTQHDLKNFILSFDQRGLAVLNTQNSQVIGSWNSNSQQVNLQLEASEVLVQQLNRNWQLVNQTSNSVELTCSGEQLILNRK